FYRAMIRARDRSGAMLIVGVYQKGAAMHKLFMLGMIAMIVLLGVQLGISPALAAEDDGSQITITAPKDGDTVGDPFELTYELVKGSKAAHAHVYLDGKYQKGFDGMFRDVPIGKHEIKVTSATVKTDVLAANQTIPVDMKCILL